MNLRYYIYPFLLLLSLCVASCSDDDPEGRTPSLQPIKRVQSISLSNNSLALKIEDYKQLTATPAPSDVTYKKILWSSNNTFVATVDDGLVKAVGIGSATITASATDGSGVKATCNVTVSSKEVLVTKITLDKTSLSMTTDDKQTIKATVSPDNATNKSINWTSSNTSVASVSSSGVVTAKAVGYAIITATAADGSGVKATCNVTVKSPVPVTKITLDKTSLSMTTDDKQTIKATVSPDNATNKSINWTSSNTSVATVSSSGVVTAKAVGSATITATAADGSGVKATCIVTVKDAIVYVSSITLSKTSLSMTAGDTQTIKATVSPDNASNKNVNWTSSNTSVATVSSSGLVTAKAAGSATITATAADGSGVKATCSVTVKPAQVPVIKITFDKTSLSMTAGDTQTIKATVSPDNATNKSINWTSSNTSVATVSSSGEVTAKAAGSATITATAADGSGVKATCSVTVKSNGPVPVENITLNKTSLSMATGDTKILSATVSPSNATNKSINWTSSNASVATVSSSGVVTAWAVGSATITATAADGSGVKGTCSVTVKSGNSIDMEDYGNDNNWN